VEVLARAESDDGMIGDALLRLPWKTAKSLGLVEKLWEPDFFDEFGKTNPCHVPSGPTGGQFCSTTQSLPVAIGVGNVDLKALEENGRVVEGKFLEGGPLDPSTEGKSIRLAFRPVDAALGGEPFTARDKEAAKEVGNWFSGLVGDMHAKAVPTLRPTAASRSNATGEFINLSKGASRTTVAHELGHFLEHKRPDAYAAAASFLKDRISGQSARKLSDITGKPHFDSDEVAVSDKFARAYSGKLYTSGRMITSTEVLSTGLEELYRSPKDFKVKDPSHYYFTLGVLHHVARGPKTLQKRTKYSLPPSVSVSP
jgi:hypothetical protein